MLHRLLAYFMQQVTVDVAEAQTAVETALFQAVSEQQDQAGHLMNMLPLQAHLRSVTDAALEREDQQAALLSSGLGTYLEQIGDYPAARPYYERALGFVKRRWGQIVPVLKLRTVT